MPVEGPLLMSRCRRVWRYDDFAYGVCPLSDYADALKCHYATSWFYDAASKLSTLFRAAGTGASRNAHTCSEIVSVSAVSA